MDGFYMFKMIVSLALVAFLFLSMYTPLQKIDVSVWIADKLEFVEVCLSNVKTMVSNILEYQKISVGERLDHLMSEVFDIEFPAENVSTFLYIQNILQGN